MPKSGEEFNNVGSVPTLEMSTNSWGTQIRKQEMIIKCDKCCYG